MTVPQKKRAPRKWSSVAEMLEDKDVQVKVPHCAENTPLLERN